MGDIWGGRAIRVGVPNPETSVNSFCVAKPGQSTLDAVAELLIGSGKGECSHWPLTLAPGQYYPRMARPSDQHLHESPGSCPEVAGDVNAIAMAEGQLDVLARELANICQTVHPGDGTFNTYGHAIRNLLILACTEVEAHWRGVLLANGVQNKTLYTSDYVQLKDAMRLSEYGVNFPHFPWLAKRRPFEGWDQNTPTKSLAWYHAYNSVKHDRENSFSSATLEHAFDAVSACAIMMLAQFGHRLPGWRDSYAMRFCNIIERPVWSPSDIYTMNYKSLWIAGRESWSAVPYAF